LSDRTFNSPLPRYRTLTICVRAALYGLVDPPVRHMIERNRMLADAKALEQMDVKVKQMQQARPV
jgi:hypothetical protein